jgi:hypothetical protein
MVNFKVPQGDGIMGEVQGRSASFPTGVKPSELFSSTARAQFLIALHLYLLRSHDLPQWRAASL